MQAFSKFAAHLIFAYEPQIEPCYWHFMHFLFADICKARRGIAYWFGILQGVCSLGLPCAFLYNKKET